MPATTTDPEGLAVRMQDPREALHCAANVALMRYDHPDDGGPVLSEWEVAAITQARDVLAKAIEYGDTVVLATSTTLTAVEADGTIVTKAGTIRPLA